MAKGEPNEIFIPKKFHETPQEVLEALIGNMPSVTESMELSRKRDRGSYPLKDRIFLDSSKNLGGSPRLGRDSVFPDKKSILAIILEDVVPPITAKDLRGLTQSPEEEQEQDALSRYYPTSPAKFVGIVEADRSFDAKVHDDWNIDGVRDVVVNAGRTALFEVSVFSNQAAVIQERLSELTASRLPAEK